MACSIHPMPHRPTAVSYTHLDVYKRQFTGGASALTPALHPEIPLADMQRLTCMLLECGATIHDINTLRKHLSRFSGGSLVRAAFPATVLGLIVSDVVGDDLDAVSYTHLLPRLPSPPKPQYHARHKGRDE